MSRFPAAAMVLAAAVVLACSGLGRPEEPPAVPSTPEEAALATFALAETSLGPPPNLEAIARVFDRERFTDDPTALLEALAALRGARNLRTVASQRLEGLGRWVVDLEGQVDGPGLAEFSVHAERRGADGWRVVWFHGPDSSWPKPPAR